MALHIVTWNVPAGHMDKNEAYDSTLESLEERFAKHASQGGVGESGGCTDASVRLSTLLKVTGPGHPVEEHVSAVPCNWKTQCSISGIVGKLSVSCQVSSWLLRTLTARRIDLAGERIARVSACDCVAQKGCHTALCVVPS